MIELAVPLPPFPPFESGDVPCIGPPPPPAPPPPAADPALGPPLHPLPPGLP